MAWVKLTDDFTEHDKIIDAGPLAGWLWVSALAWSNRNGTDGRIPIRQISRLASFDGVGVYTGTYSGDDVDPMRLADVLVDVGLFEVTEGAFLIHDYAEYQLTTDELAKRREQKSSAGRKGADSRWHGNSHDTSHSDRQGTDMARLPDPVPDVDPPLLPSSSDLESLPADLWTTIAEKKLKKAKNVGNASRWKKRVIENDKADEELVARAVQIVSMFNVTTSYLADCLLDGTSPSPAYRKQDA